MHANLRRAVTSLLFSTLTFGLAVLMGTPLSLSSTFTSLALFQLLIGPLNALPWVINGVQLGISGFWGFRIWRSRVCGSATVCSWALGCWG